MATSLETRLDSMDPLTVSGLVGRDLGELTVIEVTARKLDALARASIDDRTEPTKPLSERDIQDLSTKTTKDGVTAFFKGKIDSATTQGEAIALAKMYSNIESRAFTRIETEALPPDWMSGLSLPHMEMFETEVAPEYGKAHMRHQLGLTGPTRGVEVKKEELQARLDTGFTKLGRHLGIGKHDTFSAHIGPNGNVHTLVLKRAVLNEDEVPTGEFGEKEYFDLTTDQGIKQLLSANTGSPVTEVREGFRGKLDAIGKELGDVMDEISPRSNSSSGPRFSGSSVNNLNGADPFSHVGSRVDKTLMDQNYFKKTLLPLFEKKGLTTDGKLNASGIRAFKEITAALQLRKAEGAAIGVKLQKARKDLNDIKKNESLDHRSPEVLRDTKKLEGTIQELSRRENELKEVSEFAVSWMIVQLNAPVQVTIDGNPAQEMSVREVLELTDAKLRDEHGLVDPKFTVQGNGFTGEEVTPLTFRQKLASKTSVEFNQGALNRSRGRFQSAPDSTNFFKKRFAQKPLETSERMGGFEMGTMFYYPGILDGESDASFRIENQLRHERQGVGYTLCRDVPGVNEWVKLARQVVDLQESVGPQLGPSEMVTALPADLPKELKAHLKLQSIPEAERKVIMVRPMLQLQNLFSFAPDTKTPREALDILEKQNVVHDSRGRVGRFFHRDKS